MDDQETVFGMLAADVARDEESYAELASAIREGGEASDMRQPFVVPPDCLDRSLESPNTCMAR